MAKPKPTLQELIKAMLGFKEAGKEFYAKADDIEEVIVRRMKRERVIDLGDGNQAELVNNFDGKNKVFRPAGVKRFEIKISRRKEVAVPETEALDQGRVA